MEVKKVDTIRLSSKNCDFVSDTNTDPEHISTKIYINVLLLFFEKLSYYLITTGIKVRLPTTMGHFQVLKFKTKKHNPIDHAVTQKINKVVRHKNKGTEGFWVRLHWYKTHSRRSKDDIVKKRHAGAIFRYARYYYFQFSRPNMRPNTYNKRNPKVSLFPFFKEKGWLIYQMKY